MLFDFADITNTKKQDKYKIRTKNKGASLEFSLGLEQMTRILNEEEKGIVMRKIVRDFLYTLAQLNRVQEILKKLQIYIGPFSEEDIFAHYADWAYDIDVTQKYIQDLIKMVAVKFSTDEKFRDFFFSIVIPIYPNVSQAEKEMVRIKRDDAPEEESFRKLLKDYEQSGKFIKTLKKEEIQLLKLYCNHTLGDDYYFMLQYTLDDLEECQENIQERFFSSEIHSLFQDKLERMDAEERLLDENVWNELYTLYTKTKMEQIKNEFGMDLEILIKGFAVKSLYTLCEETISQILNVNMIPEQAFFLPSVSMEYMDDETIRAIAGYYFCEDLRVKVCNFHESEEFCDTKLTKFAIKRYIISAVADSRKEMEAEIKYIYFLCLFDIAINMLKDVNVEHSILRSTYICELDEDAAKHYHDEMEELKEKNEHASEEIRFLKEERKKLNEVINSDISRDEKMASLLDAYAKENRELKDNLIDMRAELQQEKEENEQLRAYIAMMEQPEVAETDEDVDDEEVERWLAGKKIMFFTCEDGEYITELKKMFPGCIVVNNETQSLDLVRADISVVLTKSMAHKLFFKQKSYCENTGTPLVYYNRRNLERLKIDIYLQMAKAS